MDMNTISVALTSISIASKFVKDSIEKIKDNAVREKVEELLNAIIPLMSQIITLQALNSASIKEKEALEQKVKDSENWQKEATCYELNELASGVYVYKIKEILNRPNQLIIFVLNATMRERNLFFNELDTILVVCIIFVIYVPPKLLITQKLFHFRSKKGRQHTKNLL